MEAADCTIVLYKLMLAFFVESHNHGEDWGGWRGGSIAKDREVGGLEKVSTQNW